MANVEYWFDIQEFVNGRLIIANFRRGGEMYRLTLPYDLIRHLLQVKTRRAFKKYLSLFEPTRYLETQILKYKERIVFFRQNERGRTDFSLAFSYDRGVVVEVYVLGPMRRPTGERIFLRCDMSKVPMPAQITFNYDDHIDYEDRFPSYSFAKPRSSASQGPFDLEEEAQGPLFEFSCVDRRVYFALHVVPVTSYGEAYALYERSFLVRLLSLFR